LAHAQIEESLEKAECHGEGAARVCPPAVRAVWLQVLSRSGERYEAHAGPDESTGLARDWTRVPLTGCRGRECRDAMEARADRGVVVDLYASPEHRRSFADALRPALDACVQLRRPR
jgi:hypothetical protein